MPTWTRQNSPLLPSAIVGLLVLAALAIATRFISPMLYYIAERQAGRPIGDIPVMWDFWWPAYMLVASMLWNRSGRAVGALLLLSGVQIFWITVRLSQFFTQPEWNFWTLQWLFIEAVAALFFVTTAWYILSPTGRQQLHSVAEPRVWA